MTSTHVDMDSEIKNMVMCFRVSELQVLLGHAGRNKSGRKHELMSRALQLIRANSTNKSIRKKVIDLYDQRFPNRSNFPMQSSGPVHNNNHKTLESNDHDDDSKVKFVSLPFYNLKSVIHPPKSLVSNSQRTLKEDKTSFHLTTSQLSDFMVGLKTGSETKYRYLPKNASVQVQLRFCLFGINGEQTDQLPAHLSVKVNTVCASLPPFIPPTKAGVEPRRPNQPIDITSLCYASPYTQNIIDIRWTAEQQQHYVMTIHLVQQVNANDLLQKIKSRPPISAESSRMKICDKLTKDLDSDISTTSLEVSLLCPLGKMRMTVPVRPTSCKHLQCFDAYLFLKMNERKPTWRCPVCDLPALFSHIFVDELFTTILKSCESEEITFKEDGSWHTKQRKTETLLIGTPMKPIDLSQSGCKAAAEEKKKSKEPEVIDLTVSSDEDEPLSPVKMLSRSPLQLSDDTAMSITSSPIDLGSPSVSSNHLDVPNNHRKLRSHYRSTPPYAPSSPYQRQYSPLLQKSPNNLHHSPSSYVSPVSRSPKYLPSLSPGQQSPLQNPLFKPPDSPHHLVEQSSHNPSPNPDYTHPLRSAVISQSFQNGVIETPPLGHIPSPLGSSPVGIPHLQNHSSGYNTPPFADPFLLAQYAMADPAFSAAMQHLPFMDYRTRGFGLPSVLPPADFYARTLAQTQLSTAQNEQRSRSLASNYGDDEHQQFSSDVIL